MQKIIHAIIFDLDGVIIDSNPEIEKFWLHWATKTDRQLTRENIVDHIYGRKGVETIEALFSNISAETKEAIMEDGNLFDSQMNPAPITGIHSFIQTLCSLNVPLGVVTSSHKKRALLMLEKQNILACFQAFVTAEDVTKGKPDPEPYLAIAKKLNLQPENCLVFEDAISGVLSAKAAGMEVIGINNENAADLLLQSGAITVVNSYDALYIKQHTLQLKNSVSYILQAL